MRMNRVDTAESLGSAATGGARPRVDTENLSPEEKMERKAKVVSVKVEAPKCGSCGKSVYKMEEALDSVNTVFHKDCLRCAVCKTGLTGRQRIKEESRVGMGPITKGQYLVAKSGSELGKEGDFLCEKHCIKATGEVVKAQAIDAPARNDNELHRVASMRKEANEEARQSMQLRVGDSLPTCARCGLPIDKGQNAITSGIQKFHEACPSQEEAAKAIRNVRFFIKKIPDRLITTFTCDKATHNPHTFMWDLNKDSLHDALRKKATEDCAVRYGPDAQARVKGKLVPPSSPDAREFDVVVKSGVNETMAFAFADPKNGDKPVAPKLDEASKELTITKFFLTNGVLQTLEVRLKYDEAAKHIEPISVDIKLEMCLPPEAAAEVEKDMDPLRHLKERLAESNASAAAAAAAAPAVVEVSTGVGAVASLENKPAAATPATEAKGDKAGGGGGCCVVS